MRQTVKDIYDGMVKNPIVTFALVSMAACFYMYTDLKRFVDEQKIVLTDQISNQTKTVELLNQISLRLTDIEHKLYEDIPHSNQTNSAK